MPDSPATDPALPPGPGPRVPHAPDPLRLAELLVARLSHDLSGLAGVLAGALDLAADEPDPAEALAIARDAASELAALLRLLRAAWSGETGPLRAADLDALLPGLGGGGRLHVDLAGLGTAPFPADLSRLLPNLLLLGAEALPRGGTLYLSGTPATGITLAVEGPRLAWPPALADHVASPDSAWAVASPRALQPALVVLLARSAGLTLHPGPASLRICPPNTSGSDG